MQTSSGLVRRIAVGATLSLVVGCAGTAKRVAEEATPVTVHVGLEELSRPENRELLRSLIANLPIEDVSRQAVRGIAAGALQEGFTPERIGLTSDPAAAEAQVRHLVEPYAAALARVGMDVAEREALPRVRQWVRDVVDETVVGALDERARAELNIVGARVGREFGDAAAKALAAGVREELGPALANVVTKHLTPAIAQALREELPHALEELDGSRLGELTAGASRVIAREAVYGMNDATMQLSQDEEQGEGTFFGEANDMVATGVTTAYVIAGSLGLLVLGLALGLGGVMLYTRRRRTPTLE